MTRAFIMELLVAVHMAAVAIAASRTAKEIEEGELYTLNGKKQINKAFLANVGGQWRWYPKMRGIFRKAGQTGFTVVELTMVLFILWVIAAIAVLAFILQQ